MTGNSKGRRNSSGFTLIEMLVVVAIIGILAAVAVGQYQTSIVKAKEAVLHENLFVMRTQIANYFADKGRYPFDLRALVEDKYLRDLPHDPITKSNDTWITEFAELDDADISTEPGIADVHSGAPGLSLDGSAYAVPVERVREIVRMRSVTPVPRFPADVRGVISLRGEIIELIDMRRRLGLTPIEPNRRNRIIVAYTSSGEVAAMLVDSVREVMRVPSSAIRPTAGSESGAVESLCACGDQFVSMIELDRVLTVDA